MPYVGPQRPGTRRPRALNSLNEDQPADTLFGSAKQGSAEVSAGVTAVSMGSPVASCGLPVRPGWQRVRLSLSGRTRRACRAQVLRQRLGRGPHGFGEALQPLVRQEAFDGAGDADRADGAPRLVDD